MAFYNAALRDDDGQDRYEDEERGDDSLGSRFGRWWKNLRGQGDDYEIEAEETVPETTTATIDTARPPLRMTTTSGYATAYNTRASGGSQYGMNNTSSPSSRRAETIRIAAAREGSITVMPVSSFADIQKAADRLKAGEPQIVNLEKTPPEVAERLIDFLNGVTYALDGFVEKVAEGAYLFTPAHITIQTDGPEPPAPKSIFDR